MKHLTCGLTADEIAGQIISVYEIDQKTDLLELTYVIIILLKNKDIWQEIYKM